MREVMVADGLPTTRLSARLLQTIIRDRNAADVSLVEFIILLIVALCSLRPLHALGWGLEISIL